MIVPTPQPRSGGGGSVDQPGRRRGVAGERAGRARSRPAEGERLKTSRRKKKSAARSEKPEGPQVILGILWAAITVAVTVEGKVLLALWLAPVAALAAASTLRTWPQPARRDSTTWASLSRQPLVVGAAGAAVVLAAAVDVWAALFVAVVVIVGIVVAEVQGRAASPGPFRLALVVLLPAAGASGLVLARAQGLTEAITLVAFICVYDSSAFLMGTGARFGVEGPIAGVLSIGALTLFLAAVPPFDGSTPWILGGIAAALAPAGPILARRLPAEPSARVPALRRLDSLILLGPAWVAATALLLHV
jgi:hypothetical protein